MIVNKVSVLIADLINREPVQVACRRKASRRVEVVQERNKVIIIKDPIKLIDLCRLLNFVIINTVFLMTVISTR